MSHAALRDLLARRIVEEGLPAGSPISVAELHKRLVPYVVCRESLGLATKAEYDLALLRLLADPSLDVHEAALRDAVRRELASPEPGLAILQRFAASEVRIAQAGPEPAAGHDQAGRPTRAGPPPFSLETEKLEQDWIRGLDDLEFRPAIDEEIVPASRAPSGEPSAPPTGCIACGGVLPAREGLRFCPSCGADQHSWPCSSCGARIERGWKFCAMCGVAQPG